MEALPYASIVPGSGGTAINIIDTDPCLIEHIFLRGTVTIKSTSTVLPIPGGDGHYREK